MKLKMSPVNLEWDCSWNWEEDGSCSGGLVAVCGWTALREEDLHGGKPESSEFNFKIRGDDPTFRESLRRRA